MSPQRYLQMQELIQKKTVFKLKMGNSVEKMTKSFSGDEASDVTIEYFIANIEIISNLEKWNEEDTAANAIKVLTGQDFWDRVKRVTCKNINN